MARITCANRKGQRTTVLMVAPGLIPAFPGTVPGITYNFRCEAVTMCQVGTIGLNNFVKICLGIGSAAFKLLAASFLGHWDRVQLRRSNLIGSTLKERIALTLLDLSENFGVPNRRGGMRLTVSMRHGDLAELVGASRPRVTEHLPEFTQKHLISRQNRTHWKWCNRPLRRQTVARARTNAQSLRYRANLLYRYLGTKGQSENPG